ncbi:Ig-like domain-containing protein [Pelagibacterium halotolerans]|uniref:Ig-like domain-containing protein n=1 Tax=Pelagibacterium halotolerans TaxID=531813 RepID=UPI0038511343
MSIRNGEAAPDRGRSVDLDRAHGAALSAANGAVEAAQGRERGSAFSVRVDRDANGDHALNSSEIDAGRSLAFSGTAEAGQDIVVSYTNGGPVQYYGIVTADADGKWTLPFDTEMADQNVHFTFEPAGEAEVNVDVAVDTQAPEFTSGVSVPLGPVIVNMETGKESFVPIYSGHVEGAETVELVVDGKVFASDVVGPDGEWMIRGPEDVLGDGETPVTEFVAIDAHGNKTVYDDEAVMANILGDDSATAEPRVVPYDAESGHDAASPAADAADGGNGNGAGNGHDAADNAPAASSLSVHVDGDVNDDNALNAREIGADRTLSFTGTAEPGQDVTVSHFENGHVVTDQTVPVGADGTWTYTYGSGVADQTLQFVFEQENGKALDAKVVIDTVAPEISDTSFAKDTGRSDTDRLTNDATPTFSGKVDEKATVKALIDGDAIGVGTSDADGGWTIGPVAKIADGEHALQYVATDPYGNASDAYDAKPLTIDTVNDDTIAISSVNRSRVAHTTGKVDGEETTQVRLVVDGRTAEAVTVDVTNGTWSGNVDTHVLRAGHKLEAVGIDDAGNLTEVATRIFSNAPPPPPPPPPPAPTWPVWTPPNTPRRWGSFGPMNGSPLSLDLNDNGEIDTASIKEGVKFDLWNDGVEDRISWLSDGDGLLVLDKNGNGSIDNGSELFGPTERYADGSLINEGYIEISAYDLNGDKVIDQNDSIFEDLQVWVDGNMNAVTDEGELLDIADLGIVSISIDPTDLDYTDAEGVYHKNTSTVELEDGSTMVMEDVFFEVEDDAPANDTASADVGDAMFDVYAADNGNVLPVEDQAAAIVV